MICDEILEVLSPITKEEQEFISGNDKIDRSIYMSDSSNVINSKKLLENGKLITVRKHTRFVEFPEHKHDYVEVVYMCSGSTTHIINGKEIKLNCGEILFLNQHAKQKIKRAEKDDIAINFIILPEFFDKMINMLGQEETPLRKFIIDCLCDGNSTSYLHFKVADILPIQNLIENLIFTLIHDTPNKGKINETTMTLLFLQLMNYTERLNIGDNENDVVISTLRYIEENYKSGSLTEIADSLHIDIYTLSKEIKRKTGKNYTKLLQEKRLNKAAFLLKNSDMKISTVAEKIGYDNFSYFHRIFQKAFGMTPKKYRDCKYGHFFDK